MKERRMLVGLLSLALLLMLAVGMTQAQGPETDASVSEAESGVMAAMNDVVPVQGRLTDASGTPLHGVYNITVSIYDQSTGGTALCTDTDSVQVSHGLFNAELDFCTSDDIDGRQLWLGIKVGGDPEMTPRQGIFAVPYAWGLRPGAKIKESLAGDPILELDNDGGGGALVAYGDGPIQPAIYTINTSSGGGIYAESNSTGTLLSTLYLVQRNSGGNFVVGASQAAGTRYWRVNRAGKGFFNGGTQTGGADFAEQMAVTGPEADYEPGDVLVISTDADRAVELSVEPFATAVIGVYSTEPAVLAGAPDTDDPLGGIPVTITGIVPCKVSAENGPLHRGDLLVTASTSGHAMRAGPNPPQGTVLGKALGELSEGTGVIQVLVTLQ